MQQRESGHDGDVEGKGSSLSAAITDGYEKGKASGNRTFTVHKIVVTGTNPINEYKVVLRPGG